MSHSSLLVALPLALGLALQPARAAAADASPEELFREAVASLQRGAFDDAVDRFESLADRGFVHPDASFNRAVAYVERARSSAARPGDLGRAVAALEETLAARPNEPEAEHALERIRGEIARRRARQGADPVMAKSSLSRAVVSALPERIWALFAALGSLLAAAGMAARSLARGPRLRLSGTTAAAIGALLLVAGGGFARAARHYRLTSRPAVVVVPDARLLDEAGRPLSQKGGQPEHVSAPEGTSLYVRERKGGLARIEWGTTEAWIAASQLYVVPAP